MKPEDVTVAFAAQYSFPEGEITSWTYHENAKTECLIAVAQEVVGDAYEGLSPLRSLSGSHPLNLRSSRESRSHVGPSLRGLLARIHSDHFSPSENT